MSAFKKKIGSVYYIDMTNIKANWTFLHANAKAREKHREIKSLDPTQKCIGAKRKYESPTVLKNHIEKYFESLFEVFRDKDGNIVYDSEGNPLMYQKTPATVSGLARHLGICTDTLRRYHHKSIAGVIPSEFAEVVLEARQRIEQFAEEQIYSLNGSRGAQFVLQSAFGWETKKDRSERAVSKLKRQISEQELKMKKQMSEMMDGTCDNNLKIEIVRACKGGDNE